MIINRMICLSNESTFGTIELQQGDYNSAAISLTVFETPGKLYDLSGKTVVFGYSKDGIESEELYDAVINDAQNVLLQIPALMTETEGNGFLQVAFYGDDGILNSHTMPFVVKKSYVSTGKPGTSRDPSPAFFALLKDVRSLLEAVPYIGEDGDWWRWSLEENKFVDTNSPSLPNVTFEVKTGYPGTDVEIEQSGTKQNPVITLTIPQGDTGAVDGVDYYMGYPSAPGKADPGNANGVSRGDHVHPLPTAASIGALTETDLQRNYAHNSNFRGFVAQAGVGGKHGIRPYGGDRWILDEGTITGIANTNGNGYGSIRLNGTIRQAIETPLEIMTPFVRAVSGVAQAYYGNGELTITGTDCELDWVLLLPGYWQSPTPYVPDSYAEEFAKCQRYYARQSIANRTLNGYYSGAGKSFIFPIPVEMRALPTVAVSGAGTFRTIAGYALTEGYNTSAGGDLAALELSVAHYGVMLTLPTAAVETNNSPGTLTLARDAYIDYLADLEE